MTWWTSKNTPAPTRSDTNEWIYHWAQQSLTLNALQNNTPAPVRVGGLGSIADSESYLKFVALLDGKLAKLAEESLYVWDNDFEEVRVWSQGAAFISSSEEGKKLGINVVSTDLEFVETVRAFLAENLIKREATHQGKVFMLSSSADGVAPISIGFGAVPLDILNYEKTIHSSIQDVIKDLTVQWPPGRLTIFEGPPGCGKTFLIRSLIHEVPNAQFIFVPPALVRSLGDPSFTSALLRMRDPHADREDFVYRGPTVLICEDADDILVERASDNMSSVSSLLQLTAGILGDVIDVRVICTTNAEKNKIDPATLRTGRLAHYIKINPISEEEATSALSRLMGSEQEMKNWPAAKIPKVHGKGGMGFSSNNEEIRVDGKVLLADVFKEAKSRGWEPVQGKGRPKAKVMKTRREQEVVPGSREPRILEAIHPKGKTIDYITGLKQ